MHVEIIVEDSSGHKLLEQLVPRLFGENQNAVTWRLHSYKGLGRIPKDLAKKSDPAKRVLLERLPQLLRGYGKTPGIDAVVVVVDSDTRNCELFLRELAELAETCTPRPTTLFRLAIEEVEAWYLGDRPALTRAFPRARQDVLNRYAQDSICGTWELLADALHPGGAASIKRAGWPLPGDLKHQWAERIGPHMDVDANKSPSFNKLKDGLRRLMETI